MSSTKNLLAEFRELYPDCDNPKCSDVYLKVTSRAMLCMLCSRSMELGTPVVPERL